MDLRVHPPSLPTRIVPFSMSAQNQTNLFVVFGLPILRLPQIPIQHTSPSLRSYSRSIVRTLNNRFFLLRKARFINLSTSLYVDRPMDNSKKNTSSTYPQLLLPASQPNSRLPTRLRGMTQSDSHQHSFSQEAYATIRQRYLSSPGSRPLPSRGTTSPFPSWVPGSQLSSHPIKRPSSSGCILPNQSATAVPISHTQTIIRRTSTQRLQPPPTPPIHELPPQPSDATGEPLLESQVEDQLDSQPNCSGSSSSSISFVSSTSSNEKLVNTFDRIKEQDPEDRSFVANLQPEPKMADNLIPSASRPLAEIVRVPLHCPSSQRPPSVQSPTSTLPLEASQVLQESKSYDQFEHGLSTTPSSQLPEPLTHLAQDTRYGSTLSHTSNSASVSVSPMQRRVFSGSNFRRPSTSSGVSTRLDHGIPTSASPSKTRPANRLKLRSFWEDHPPSPTQSDHLLQPIISPDLLAQIEADLEDRSSLGSLPLLSISSDCGQERTMRTPTASSDRYSEVNSSSISSQSLSEVSKTPPLSAKLITVPMIETGNLSGTIVGRTVSLVKARPSTTSSLSRRPATASGTTSLGPLLPMPTLHEPEVKSFRPVHIDTLSPTHSGMTPTPISPLGLRKSQQEGSNAGNVKLPPLQLGSLPPPPRPRAKAETVTQLQKAPEEPRQKRGRLKNSIGIDFGPEQRRVISPSIQPNVYCPPSQPMAQPATSGTRPIPPGDPSRPLVQSCRQPEPPDGVQEIPSQKVLSNTIPSNEQQLSHRISLQRKPSFLDIDKDDDTEADGISDSQFMKSTLSGPLSFSLSATESFLEFESESFDTIRIRP